MKNEVNKFFDGVTPVRSDDEITADVLRKAENMKKENTKRIRKPFVAACAAAVVVGLGATAAAAVLIDFDMVFSRHITVDNDETAAKILADVSGVITRVSDENYNAELQAVISDGGTLVGCVRLSRRDGSPVADGFARPLPDMQDGRLYLSTSEWHGMALGTGYQYIDTGVESRALEIVCNENGSLDIYFDIIKNYEPEMGKAVVLFRDISYVDADTGISEMLLPIEVRVQFGYKPSEDALVSRTISVPDKMFDLNAGVNGPLKARVIESKLNCTSATITLKLEEQGDISMFFGGEEFNLIRNGEVVGRMQSYRTDFNGIAFGNTVPQMVFSTTAEGDTTISFNCRYRNNDGLITAFDISEIDAVEIYGTVYPLK